MSRHVIAIPVRSLRDPGLVSTLNGINDQDLAPDLVLLAVPPEEAQTSHEFEVHLTAPWRIVVSSRAGTASQRNALLESVTGEDVLHFVDADIRLSPDYLSSMAKHFRSTDLVGICGHLLFPRSPTNAESWLRSLLRHFALSAPKPGRISRTGVNRQAVRGDHTLTRTFWMPGGCMSVRLSAGGHVRFCEDLEQGPTGPYAMAEDVHYSLQLGKFGALAKAWDCQAAHLGNEEWKDTDPSFWEMKVYSRMILARDHPDIVGPSFVRYGAMCDLIAQTLLRSGSRRSAAQRGLTRGLARSFKVRSNEHRPRQMESGS